MSLLGEQPYSILRYGVVRRSKGKVVPQDSPEVIDGVIISIQPANTSDTNTAQLLLGPRGDGSEELLKGYTEQDVRPASKSRQTPADIILIEDPIFGDMAKWKVLTAKPYRDNDGNKHRKLLLVRMNT